MAKVIGIDLGTTNSCVAVMEADEPVVIPNAEGSRTTPSLLAFSESGERLVGQIAKRQALTNPENTIHGIKRLVGRRYDSPEVEELRERTTYEVIRAENGDAWVEGGGRRLSPAEISAMILARLKHTAEEFLGEPVTDAVVTVPAYFDDAQRQATKDAGRIAGLNVLRIINEPTAAALAYGLDRSRKARPERIAVYDLGGGTFDISILELTQGVFEVRATNGDTFLGGEDFDQRIIDWLADRFKADNGIDLRRDRMALQRLKEAAERAKHELSSATETEINLPFICADASGPRHLTETMTRDDLEALVESLVQHTIEPCRIALKDAGISPGQIDKVILVGGMTRMPRVQQVVKEFFGKEPHKGVNPDEVVAMGAAIHAASLSGDVEEVLLLDVTPLSIGVETGGGVFTKLIPRNTTIPTEKSEIFTTSIDGQSFVPVHVLQGERQMAADNRSLTHFELTGIPPAPRGVPKIQVTFRVDANGILDVEAKDLGTGKSQQIRVTPSSGLSQDQIEKLIAEGEMYDQADRQRRELAELRNEAETLYYTTQQALEGYADLVSPEMLESVTEANQNLRQALDAAGDLQTLRDAYQAVEALAFKIAESLYGESETED